VHDVAADPSILVLEEQMVSAAGVFDPGVVDDVVVFVIDRGVVLVTGIAIAIIVIDLGAQENGVCGRIAKRCTVAPHGVAAAAEDQERDADGTSRERTPSKPGPHAAPPERLRAGASRAATSS